tara:strand:- start:321 stop:1151 length:831 start_codon:yes stop_codon:yes gene_type:complete
MQQNVVKVHKMNKNFDFQYPTEKLPIESSRDLANVIKQDIKFRILPFRAYYKYRAYKYAKKITPELNIIHKISNKDKVSLDVGANLGLFTYFMSRSSKKVYAFEPNPYPLRNLKHVVDKNVEIVPIAIGNKDGKEKIKIPKNRKGWSSNGASFANIDINRGIEYLVDIRKIDSLNIKNIGLIKIDVEGFEIDVIKGAIGTLEEQKPNLIIENEIVHNDNPYELFDIMKDIGYKIFFVNKVKELIEVSKDFDFKNNQHDPGKKDYNYIQNFIFIPSS